MTAPSLAGGAACKSDGRYFIWMAKKDRKTKAKPSGEKWIVYIVRCADSSLYTGITKDVTRRCQQHNAGTASRYTRSRRPVKLVYQEAHPSQSSALKREVAIKTMTRREKLAMIRVRKKAG
jgi:predicted GIY-YIG superfamily endonuclease